MYDYLYNSFEGLSLSFWTSQQKWGAVTFSCGRGVALACCGCKYTVTAEDADVKHGQSRSICAANPCELRESSESLKLFMKGSQSEETWLKWRMASK